MKNDLNATETINEVLHEMDESQTLALKSIREVQIEIVQEIERICKLENLNYFMMFGTLLGAVRHKGFIPWDDDIDLGMLRKDYDLFIDAFDKHASDKYVLQIVERDPYYAFFFMKILRKDSIMIEEGYQDDRKLNGIFVDVFPFDNAPSNHFAQVLQNKACIFFMSLLFYQVGRMDPNQGSFPVRCVKKFKNLLSKALSRKTIINISTSIMKMKKEGKYLLTFGDTYIYKTEQMKDLVPTQFENYKFQAPRLTDDALTCLYGDYMKLPPLEQRVMPHRIIKVEIDGKTIL